MKLLPALITVISLLCALPATADVIYLKNGDRITGEIKEIWDSNVTIEPEYSNKFDVEFEHIAHIESDEAFEVELLDGREGDFSFAKSSVEGGVRLEASNASIEVALANINKIEEIKDFDWDSKLDLNSNFSRGNTNSQTVNISAETEVIKGQHRYLGDFSYVLETLDSETTKEQTRFHASYNYLFEEGRLDNWFFATNVTLERDPVALLDRRLSLNPALGYDVWDYANRTLNFEFGVGYANEETDGEDTSSATIDWRLNFAYDFMGGDLELFHNHHIYRNVSGRKNIVFNTNTGVRYEITDDIYMNVQLDYDYDTEPPDGTDNEDLTFLLGAGIEF